jgi:transposase-like protein
MLDQKRILGFCPMCMQNVEHTRKFSFPLFGLLDLLTLRVLRFARIGPWFCFQCEQKTIYLPLPRRGAPTFCIDQSRAHFRGGAQVDPFVEQGLNDQSSSQESIGNYLKSEQSLVMRNQRSQKYSQKFRDASVMRILSGATTFSQARHELGVVENDLIAWIADLLARKQDRIDELAVALKSVQANFPLHLHSTPGEPGEPDLADVEGESVIEGRVTPK